MLKVETSQRELHDMLRRKNLIGEEELRSLDCKCYEEFATYWTRLLERTKSDFDHRKGWKKWARKYQSFATGADHFMKDFSPIVELTRAAGPPYSDLAVGTITALFTVSIEITVEREQLISDSDCLRKKQDRRYHFIRHH